jgi:hypothetical protein
MEETFKIIDKKTHFKNVTRIIANSDNNYNLQIDVNNLFFEPLGGPTGIDTFKLVLSKQLDINADYIMKGNLLKKDSNNTYVSYSGLLMQIDTLLDYDFGEDIYCNIFYKN